MIAGIHSLEVEKIAEGKRNAIGDIIRPRKLREVEQLFHHGLDLAFGRLSVTGDPLFDLQRGVTAYWDANRCHQE
jgi:hypothetical protein